MMKLNEIADIVVFKHLASKIVPIYHYKWNLQAIRALKKVYSHLLDGPSSV